jgi:agmatine/peptidylarginine deiminase
LLWCCFVLPAQELREALSSGECQYLVNTYGLPGDTVWQSWQRYLQHQISDRANISAPPAGTIVCAPAEFQKAAGIFFSWRGYSSLLKSLICEVARESKAYVAVSENAEAVRQELVEFGCTMANVEILSTPTDTVWIRDYAPWAVYTRNGELALVDFVYNRPRPRDDRFSDYWTANSQRPLYICQMVLPGGNLLLDGCGGALLSDMIFDAAQGADPLLTRQDVSRYLSAYLNCHIVHILEKMEQDGTGHIDMFCKLLDRRHILVGEYRRVSDGAGDNYHILNRNASKLATLKNGLGENFIVHRIPMPAYDGNTYSYTNSLLVNGKVLLPLYDKPEDEVARRIYQKLLPTYKVIAFDCRQVISANGAIHCITHSIAADPKIKN